MRQYPRLVHKEHGNYKKVWNESEEIQASIDGYESHWNPEIVEKRKGTDREILRGVKKAEIIRNEPIESLAWPKLKTYAKGLETKYGVDIVTRSSKRADILAKIKELENVSDG